MEIIKRTSLGEKDKNEIIRLWNNEYPTDIAMKNIQAFNNYLSKHRPFFHLLIKDKSKQIIAWLYYFERDIENWFSMIIDSNHQKKGIGSLLLTELKKYSHLVNGWVVANNNFVKLNGEAYPSPLLFYVKNGFKIYPEIRFKTKEMDGVKIQWKS